MTEIEWLTGTDAIAMLSFLRNRGVSNRKLRLFAVACSRRVWSAIDDLGRAAVELAESFADGGADAEQLRAARLACKGSGGQSSWYAAVSDPAIAARNAALSALDGVTNPEAERFAQAELLRCIFGNPFKPVFDLSCRTATVVSLARQMYESRDFSAMLRLADALQQAGCEEKAILAHCREAELHHRGCFVMDLLLNKT